MATIRCKSAFLMRSDTSENWKGNNPVLRQGEEGYETDTGRRKVGDGSAAWNTLPYSDDALCKAIDDSAKKLTSEIASTAEKERTLSDNTYSNALKGSVSGTMLNIGDISPLKHNLSVKVQSKNLVPFPYLVSGTVTQSGVTIIFNDDGTFTASGTSTGEIWLKLNDFSLPKGTYKFTGCPTGASTNTFTLRYAKTHSQDTDTTLTVTDDDVHSLYLYIKTGRSLTDAVFKPQIEKGDAITDFTPYISDLTTVEVSKCGKNLIPYPYATASETTVYGVTFTVNDDGSIIANGAAEGEGTLASFMILSRDTKPWESFKETMYLSGAPTVEGTYSLQAKVENDNGELEWYTDQGSGVSIPKGTRLRTITVYIRGKCTNFTFKPQLEIGSTATSYEQYIQPTTYTPLADGTVEGVESLYPTTTLLTDTDGVVIDCEYNKDINKAYAQLLEKVSALAAENANN